MNVYDVDDLGVLEQFGGSGRACSHGAGEGLHAVGQSAELVPLLTVEGGFQCLKTGSIYKAGI